MLVADTWSTNSAWVLYVDDLRICFWCDLEKPLLQRDIHMNITHRKYVKLSVDVRDAGTPNSLLFMNKIRIIYIYIIIVVHYLSASMA